MNKITQLDVSLEVRFVPMDGIRLTEWRARLLLLMDLLLGETRDGSEAVQLQEFLSKDPAGE
jgi:hypothetical protein